MPSYLLKEDGSKILLENGSGLLLQLSVNDFVLSSDGSSTPVISKLNRKRPFAIGGVTASAGTSLITNIKKVFAITSTAVANTLFEFTTYISVIYKQFVVSSDITSTTSLAFNVKKVFVISSAIVSAVTIAILNRTRPFIFGSVTGISTTSLNRLNRLRKFILVASGVTTTALEFLSKTTMQFVLTSVAILNTVVSRLNIKKSFILISTASSIAIVSIAFKKLFSLISNAISTAIIYNYWLPGSMEYYNMRKNLKVAIIKLKRI